jgi:hypothetical protein
VKRADLDPRVRLRPRSLDESADLALAYLRVHRAAFAPLAALVVLVTVVPSATAIALGAPWAAVLAALVLVGGALDRPVVVFAGRHLFDPSTRVRAAVGAAARQSLGATLTSALMTLPFAVTAWMFRDPDAEDGAAYALLAFAAMFWPLLVGSLAFLPPVHALEGRGFRPALRRALALARLRGGRAVAFTIFAATARLGLALTLALATEFVVSVLLQLAPADDPFTDAAGSWAFVAGWALAGVYVSVARVLEYVDARTRVEGWDIQVRFRAIAARLEAEAEARFGASPPAASLLPPLVAPLVLALALGGSSSACTSQRRYEDRGPKGGRALVELLEGLGHDVDVKRGRVESAPPDTRLVILNVRRAAHDERLELAGLRTIGAPVVLFLESSGDAGLLTLGSTTALVGAPLDLDDDGRAKTSSRTPTMIFEAPAQRLPLSPHPTCGFDPGLFAPDGGPELTVVAESEFGLTWDGHPRTSTLTGFPVDAVPILGRGPEHPAYTSAYAFALAPPDTHDAPWFRCVFVFAGFSPFTNAGLAFPENARFAAGFFSSLVEQPGKILVVDDWHGKAATARESLTSRLGESAMTPLLAQLLVLVIVWFTAMGAAFGTLRDPPRRTHKAFREHVAALGAHYARLGERGKLHAATALARWVVHRARLDAGSAGAQGSEATATRRQLVAAQLAEAHGLELTDVTDALALASPDAPLPATPERLGRLLGTLGTIVARTTRTHRR